MPRGIAGTAHGTARGTAREHSTRHSTRYSTRHSTRYSTRNASQSSTFATEPTIPLACKADTASAGKKQGVAGTGARGIPGMPNIAARVSGLLVSTPPIELFFDSAFKLPEVRGKQCTGE